MKHNKILCLTSNLPRWQGDSTTPFVMNLARAISGLRCLGSSSGRGLNSIFDPDPLLTFAQQDSGWGCTVGSPQASDVEACMILALTRLAKSEHVYGAVHRGLGGLNRVELVMDGCGRAGRVKVCLPRL